jgi:hydrogenase maturation protease
MVVGIGNLIKEDDGVGVHAIKALQELDFPEDVELVDGGITSYDLVDEFCQAENLIIIDAMYTGGEPGTMYRAPLEELQIERNEGITSVHGLNFVEALYMVNQLGYFPQTIVFGVEPASLNCGLELSPLVAQKMPRLVELIQQEINRILAQ